ncbi:Site-specific recombinase XerD [Pseudobutyrivibrio sp. 49]|uniref:tyrosine-type recombinase/integrase n=1 Tax=Pseudobutyrivibrio sp. 49 TaxID=1855344 RepID=UPI00088779B8|nr:tyrosine-type recombinase/integrase [Pseudobutyrivibrio sp. 49]SDI55514.1 Site-specific recombinase XerD [Pseudobutyrivibrio sp. 49]
MSKLSSEEQLLYQKTENLVKTKMPAFAGIYFRTNEESMSAGSIYGYAIDMVAFFEFMSSRMSYSVKDMSIKDFESVTDALIEDYLIASQTCCLGNRSIAAIRRRYAVLRSFYMFYYTQNLIDNIPILKVKQPKLVKQRNYMPSMEEKLQLLQFISEGTLPSTRASNYQKNTRKRDLAITLLLAGVGLKISECVMLNINDLHLDEGYIVVKSRNNNIVNISSSICIVLSQYLSERLGMIAEYGYDDALFLSLQRKRISQDCIEEFIKKYTTALFGESIKIAPKDLTLSYREDLFFDTKNIAFAADKCGCDPFTIFNIYKADILELQSNPVISNRL